MPRLGMPESFSVTTNVTLKFHYMFASHTLMGENIWHTTKIDV